VYHLQLTWLGRLASAFRIHQWSKNLLLFVPLAAAHGLLDLRRLLAVLLAFVTVSFAASAGYLINDLRDRDFDREHPTKRLRPIASGNMTRGLARALVTVLAIGAGLGSSLLSHGFQGWLALYFCGTILYTILLKNLVIVDVLSLAGLHTIRIFAGGAAAGVAISEWLLMLSMFLFLSLAIAKRYAEIEFAREAGIVALIGRPYDVTDRDVLRDLGIASGYASVLVFALYISSDQVHLLYAHPHMLWFVCPLMLFWISRLWLLSHRRAISIDPIISATTDPASWIVGGLAVLVAVLAT
jgi:4-hydroxybenzoate polyprenyltransferase